MNLNSNFEFKCLLILSENLKGACTGNQVLRLKKKLQKSVVNRKSSDLYRHGQQLETQQLNALHCPLLPDTYVVQWYTLLRLNQTAASSDFFVLGVKLTRAAAHCFPTRRTSTAISRACVAARSCTTTVDEFSTRAPSTPAVEASTACIGCKRARPGSPLSEYGVTIHFIW